MESNMPRQPCATMKHGLMLHSMWVFASSTMRAKSTQFGRQDLQCTQHDCCAAASSWTGRFSCHKRKLQKCSHALGRPSCFSRPTGQSFTKPIVGMHTQRILWRAFSSAVASSPSTKKYFIVRLLLHLPATESCWCT